MSRHEDGTVATAQRWLLLTIRRRPNRLTPGVKIRRRLQSIGSGPKRTASRSRSTVANYSARDRAFGVEGRVALWTKADSITRFEDIRLLGDESRTQEGEEP